MPKMAHGDFDRYGFLFWNHHKKVFGVKMEVAVAFQRTPIPIGVSVVPAGWQDIEIARLSNGAFAHMSPEERALGDPGYHGNPEKIYAPPKRNMLAFVEHVDKSELDIQRRVELANRYLKEFKCLGTTYRKGAVRAYGDLMLIGVVIAKLVVLEILLNQENYGNVHVTGPKKRRDPGRNRRASLRVPTVARKISPRPRHLAARVRRAASQRCLRAKKTWSFALKIGKKKCFCK
jgi:hypothetical protein